VTQCLLEKSNLAQHACEEGNKLCWNEGKILQFEPNTTYRKYKESTHMSLLDHPISQPHLDSRYHSRSQGTTTPPGVV
jgi:hypothetical protein